MSQPQRYVPPHRRRGQHNRTADRGFAGTTKGTGPTKLAAGEFQSTYRNHGVREEWGKVRYNVHSPKCSCSKLANLRGFDNLIIVPKSGQVHAVYVCEGTNQKAFIEDAKSCEMKLAAEIFNRGDTVESNVKPDVSCAGCLLTADDSKNGFLAICAKSSEDLETTILNAIGRAIVDQQNGTISKDHGHFVIAVKLSTLLLLRDDPKSTHAQSDLAMSLQQALEMMESGGAALSIAAQDMLLQMSSTIRLELVLGHHIKFFLEQLLDDNLKYVMLFGYIDSPTKIQLDLPGGKRYLGESTLDCAIRKADRECSVKIDRDWLSSRVPSKYGGSLSTRNMSVEDSVLSTIKVNVIAGQDEERTNVYFVIPPPVLQSEY